MPNHTLQILRLLRFAGLISLLGSVASASAETVGERAKKDPSFKIYPVIFSVTATSNSTPPAVRVVDRELQKGRAKIIVKYRRRRRRRLSRQHGLKQRRR